MRTTTATKDVVSDLSTIIRNKLRRILEPKSEAPPKPNKQERIVAEKHAKAAATARIVERKIELGRKLVALREVTPSNRISAVPSASGSVSTTRTA